MRSLLRFGALGCALALTALPLAIGGGGTVAGAALSSPATVSASNWTRMANTVNTPANNTAGRRRVLRDLGLVRGGAGHGDTVDAERWTSNSGTARLVADGLADGGR